MPETPASPPNGPENPAVPTASDDPAKLTKAGRPRKKTGPPKGSRGGGKKKGSKHKTTLRREELERMAREAAASAVAGESMIETFDRKATPETKRAKKVLETFMELFAGMAATYQPLPPGRKLLAEEVDKRSPDESKFKEYASLAVETAKALAPFQDPRYSAMIVGASVVTKVEVTGGMPNDFDPPSVAGEILDLKPGTIVTADVDPEPPILVIEPPKAVNE